MLAALKHKKVKKVFNLLKPKQGFYVGKVKVDPVYGVIGLTALYFVFQSTPIERFIYWVEIKAQEMTYERDLSNDPMGVMKDNLRDFALVNKSDNPVEVYLDGVTTYKYLETTFRVSFGFEAENMRQCRLTVSGQLKDRIGPIVGAKTSLDIWCTKNSRETKISSISPNSFLKLPNLEDQPLLVRFAINGDDEGYKTYLASFNVKSNLQESEQLAPLEQVAPEGS
ncbi:hypothetical protein H5185_12455 [Shewanella sp. SG44-6]|jgi:hypothetical protein|uniref:hypothetical protein n=1 Tax=Shewanella sp. SG44-6 TaxID=2760959 RepID=UPI001603B502|nr:hypothetical protein [Shewanella sp. SG44-6]MBB1390226.1 hypothetical protein [Shewanella sp. SG44-6]